MSDILYSAAIAYQKLEKVLYKIVIGRKGTSHILNIHFPQEAFFHLAGLQHLTDITFPSTNKERVYKEILKQNLGIRNIQKSVFFKKCFIEERLKSLQHIEHMLDSNAVTYLINNKNYAQYSRIRADYLCERKMSAEIFYLFIVRELKSPKFHDECKCCSFFKKHKKDYTKGTSKTTTLLIEKRENNNVVQIYRNDSYKEN